MTIRSKIEERMKNYPDDKAFLFRKKDSAGIGEITSKQFWKDVSTLGGELLRRGYYKKNIAIFGENSYDWALAFFSVTASGNTAVLLDYHLPENELTELVAFTDCECVLYSSTYEDIANVMAKKTGIPFFETSDLFGKICREQENMEAFGSVTVEESDVAAIAFTSGTSGKYKAVMLSNYGIIADTESLSREFKPNGMCLLILPLYHMFGMLNVFTYLFVGGCCFIEDSMRNIFKDTGTYHFDLISAVPVMLPVIYEAYKSNHNGNGVRIICGGAPESRNMFDKITDLGIDNYAGYGMTECSPCIALGNSCNENGEFFMNVLDVNKVTIDSPDENGTGEILVSGKNVMTGYYKMPEETEKVLENGVLKTGDLGRLDADGRLCVTGRKKNLIVLSNGEKVSPEAVEQQMRRIKDVAECMLTEQNGELVLSVWAPEGNSDAIRKEILNRNRLFPGSRRIAKIVFAENSFATNSIGKTVRN